MSSAGGGGVPTTFEVETSDVIKLILQFCKENHLLHTLKTLQEESQVRIKACLPMASYRGPCWARFFHDVQLDLGVLVSRMSMTCVWCCRWEVAMNTVDSMENFLSDIIQGRWESVLPQVAGLQLPQDKLLGKEARADTQRRTMSV